MNKTQKGISKLDSQKYSLYVNFITCQEETSSCRKYNTVINLIKHTQSPQELKQKTANNILQSNAPHQPQTAGYSG